MESRDLAFYSVPIAIACVAGFFAFRYFHDGPEREAAKDPAVPVVDPCFAGRYRCRDGALEVTTGDRGDGDVCTWKRGETCAKACVADGVTLFGPTPAIAHAQLCDAPANTIDFAEPVAVDESAATCEHDGFGPNADGIVQCVLKPGNDPNALGLVIAQLRCKTGVVATEDMTPQLVSRDQAIAIWCRRDAQALARIDAGTATAVDAGDAGAVDAASDSAADSADSSIDAALDGAKSPP